MARLKANEGLSVSLFPMFNILVCTLGVLIFIMSTITTISLGNDKTLKVVENKKPGALNKIPHHFVWDGVSLISLEIKDTLFFKADFKAIKKISESKIYLKNTINNSEAGKLISKIKQNSKTDYIIVFVRERGFENFISFREYVKSEGIDIGYEPIDNYSRIKL
jgi:hypothetical protein